MQHRKSQYVHGLIIILFVAVISYVLESDADVAKEIEKVTVNRERTFDSVFSRNKLLRRRINRKKGRSVE
jgi:hypothetical protein